LLLFSVGCQTDSRAKANSDGPSGQSVLEPREVHVIGAGEERVTRTIEATGTLAAQDQVDLAMKVSGRIASIEVDLGDRVRQGQVIARLEPTDFRIQAEQANAALQQARTRLGLLPEGADDQQVDPKETSTVRQAEASLTEARLNRDRAQQLFDEQLIPRADLDAAVAAYEVAESGYENAIDEVRNRQAMLSQRRAELELAKHQLDQTVLVSPIDGAVSARQGSAGQFFPAGSALVTIVRVHPLRLRLPVPERATAGVRVGQQVRLHVEQDPNVYYGRVARLSPSIDEANRTLMVEAEVPNERGLLRPGAFVRAEMITAEDRMAVFVPASALVTFAGIEKVFVAENGMSVEKLVRTGRKSSDKIEITEGLKAGELVVVQPGSLVGGQPIIIKE
jgi:RND family efflux transporter MFP subunit